jgi:glycosyltransferase involved in cell wall biosynthesis
MRRLRLLLVLHASTGGIGTHVAMLAEDLARHHDVTVLAPARTLARADFAALRANGVTLTVNTRRRRSLRELIHAADVVHAHGYHAGLSMLTQAPVLARRQLVCTWHNLPPRGSLPQQVSGAAVATVLARGSRMTLGASDDLVALAARMGARHARPFPVVAPSLPPPAVTPALLRARLGVDPEQPIGVAVGRLAPQKDQATMVEAWARLGDLRPAPVLLIAGDGPLRASLERRIVHTGAQVRLLGHRDDVADLLAAASLAVNSSTWEARALVAQEALLRGVPFVGTAVGGVPGLVDGAAVLVPPGDAPAFAEACRRVLTDASLVERLRVEGLRQSATWPDRRAAAALAESLYAEIAGTPDTPGSPTPD